MEKETVPSNLSRDPAQPMLPRHRSYLTTIEGYCENRIRKNKRGGGQLVKLIFGVRVSTNIYLFPSRSLSLYHTDSWGRGQGQASVFPNSEKVWGLGVHYLSTVLLDFLLFFTAFMIRLDMYVNLNLNPDPHPNFILWFLEDWIWCSISLRGPWDSIINVFPFLNQSRQKTKF